MGLEDTFETIKMQILSTKPMSSLEVIYHLVSEDEQQRNIYTAIKFNIDTTTYHVCAQNIVDKNQFEKNNTSKEGMKCKHYRKNEHTIDECFEKIRYPDKWEQNMLQVKIRISLT